MLIKRFEHMKQTENDTVREFSTRFANLLHQIIKIHYPKDKYLVELYTNALSVHLGFLLSKKRSRTIQ
jgi:hypothetical protein